MYLYSRRKDGRGALFEEFKGALTEQYACQELIASCGLVPYYWSAENSRGEVDFLVQSAGAVYAIEVKAEENLRTKSLRSFKESTQKLRPGASPFPTTASKTGSPTSLSTSWGTRGFGCSDEAAL